MQLNTSKKLLLLCLLVLPYSLEAQSNPKRIVVDEGVSITTNSTRERRLKRKVAIGRFSNETQYGKGIFYDRDNDPMAKQALDILSTKLVASGKFILIERSDISLVKEEGQVSGTQQSVGADYLILGSITEYGRKTTGKEGLFTTQKTQTVEAGVSIRVVDVHTGLVIYSEEGKGAAETSTKTTLGLGGQAGFDATLADKAISGAIEQLVENVINKCSDKPWRTYFLSMDDETYFIAGGKEQGLSIGDIFDIYSKGKKVKNPQTGLMIELPGKKVSSLRVEELMGDTAETEFALVSIIGNKLSSDSPEDYYIEAPKQ